MQRHFLEKWIPNNGDYRLFCEVLIQQCGENQSFTAIHKSDRETPKTELKTLDSLQSVEELSETTECGKLRPIRTAPNLKSGWIISEDCLETFVTKLDTLYPEAITDTAGYYEETIEPISFRDLLKDSEYSQLAAQITDAQINQVMRNTCFRGCLRRIAWGIDNQCEVSRLPQPQNSIPAVCNQACKPALLAASDLFN